VTIPKRLLFLSCSCSISRCNLPLVLLGLLLSLLVVQLPVLAALGASADRKHEKPYALIYGTVWGPDNRPVYGVKVRIRRPDQKKAKWELYSDHSGEFAQRVPAGKADYVIWADVKDFKSQDGRHLRPGDEVKIHIENDERADIGLHLKQ